MANIHGNELGIYINVADYTADGAVTDFSAIDNFDDTTTDPDEYPLQDALTNADLGEWVLVACATTCSLNLSNATIETTCKKSTSGALDDASVRHTIPGQQTWNMNVDGLVDLAVDAADATETGFANLMDLALNRTPILVAFSTGVEGTREYVGKGFISSIDATAGVDDFATYSATIEGNGTLEARATAMTGATTAE